MFLLFCIFLEQATKQVHLRITYSGVKSLCLTTFCTNLVLTYYLLSSWLSITFTVENFLHKGLVGILLVWVDLLPLFSFLLHFCFFLELKPNGSVMLKLLIINQIKPTFTQIWINKISWCVLQNYHRTTAYIVTFKEGLKGKKSTEMRVSLPEQALISHFHN